MNSRLLFVPKPKKLNERSGSLRLTPDSKIVIPASKKAELFPIAKRAQMVIEENCSVRLAIAVTKPRNDSSYLSFARDDSLAADAYLLSVNETGIEISYSSESSAFYAVSTLKQVVIQSGNNLPCLDISDAPDFKARGAMLDISRDKIPKLETLFEFVDLMADLKLNQLQLYIEGFPFAYPSFPDVWRGETPLTGEDLIELDGYCTSRYVELVPNQNSFGHMGPWLSRNEFVHLAEETAGKAAYGRYWKAVLNPIDPKSIEFIRTTYDDLLPYFSSDLFNVCCDEVALGQDKTKELCEEVGAGRVFLDYVMKIYELTKERQKTMMLWGDVVFEHPELFEELPRDIIVLDWGYTHDFPYDDHGAMLASMKQPFYVCPGTGSWRSITGRTDNTMENLRNAAVNGKKHGALGYLITDWGDRGHLQYIPVSYPGFVYGAGLCWAVEENLDLDVAACLDTFVFEDESRVVGELMLELGRYCLKESNPGIFGPNLFSVLIDTTPLDDAKAVQGVTAEGLRRVEDYIQVLYEKLSLSTLRCKDADTVVSELRNAMRLLIHAIKLSHLRLSRSQTTRVTNDAFESVEPADLLDDISEILNNHIELWVTRNRVGGLSRSLFPIESLRREYAKLSD